ncbi:MAG: YIP1 family protein [Halobaculum sp.]
MQLLTDPDSFFAERASDPDWLLPTLVVLGNAAFGAVGVWYLLDFSMRGIESGVTTIPLAIGVGTAVVTPLVLWAVYAGVFHGLSAFFDGDGSFSRTLYLSGWGYLPSLVGSLAVAVAFYYAAQAVPPAASIQELGAVQRQIQNHQYVQWANWLGVALTLWQGVLWTYAVRHARDLSVRQAALVVALPILVSVGLSLNSLL